MKKYKKKNDIMLLMPEYVTAEAYSVDDGRIWYKISETEITLPAYKFEMIYNEYPINKPEMPPEPKIIGKGVPKKRNLK